MATPIQVRLGTRVRQLREAADWSQEELAARAKLSRHYLSELEGGCRNPSVRVAEQLAVALRVKLRDLMDL